MEKYVDCVVFVKKHEECESLVQMAVKHNVILIPFGGGTNVTHCLNPVTSDSRMVISVDTSRMNSIKWVDKKNM